MKHFNAVSKTPSRAADIPIQDLMTFITSVLTDVATLLVAKEAPAAGETTD